MRHSALRSLLEGRADAEATHLSLSQLLTFLLRRIPRSCGPRGVKRTHEAGAKACQRASQKLALFGVSTTPQNFVSSVRCFAGQIALRSDDSGSGQAPQCGGLVADNRDEEATSDFGEILRQRRSFPVLVGTENSLPFEQLRRRSSAVPAYASLREISSRRASGPSGIDDPMATDMNRLSRD